MWVNRSAAKLGCRFDVAGQVPAEQRQRNVPRGVEFPEGGGVERGNEEVTVGVGDDPEQALGEPALFEFDVEQAVSRNDVEDGS